MATAAQQRRMGRIITLEVALRRLDDGDYGYCVECGEEIAPRRLVINPHRIIC